MAIRQATKLVSKLKMGIAGPSGSGKTYSALLLASGLTAWDKICVIDTENGSADLYSHLGNYNVSLLNGPFTPEKYIAAIQEAENAGMEVIIIDSMTHEWDGKGGILEMHDALPGNSYTNWAKLTPRHNKFIEAILQSPCHVICCLRSKQDYVLVEKNGKQVPEKVGLRAITREGVEYEMTLVFDINIKHQATSSKDRTGLFVDKPEFLIDQATGKMILDWTKQGVKRYMALGSEITKETIKEIKKLAKETKMDLAKPLAFFKVDAIDELTEVEGIKMVEKLNKIKNPPAPVPEKVEETVDIDAVAKAIDYSEKKATPGGLMLLKAMIMKKAKELDMPIDELEKSLLIDYPKITVLKELTMKECNEVINNVTNIGAH
jgi:hypothetical protein